MKIKQYELYTKLMKSNYVKSVMMPNIMKVKNIKIQIQQDKLNQPTKREAMNTKSAMSEHVDKYTRQIHDLLVIIISDNEGVHIYSASHQSVKDKLEKIIQTSTMLIRNYQKIGKTKLINPITYYYDEFLIHFRKTKHFNITLFLRPKASGLLAEEISAQLITNFGFLNNSLAKKD